VALLPRVPDPFAVRPAAVRDVPALCAMDALARQDESRRALIARAVEAGHAYVIEAQQQVIGYAVLDTSFFGQGFVSLLYIHPEHRRRGAGFRLMQYLEQVCPTPKLFTSTNLSNLPMQALLAKLGYILSGIIHHLDENDPELVYVKYLRRGRA
jgi:GNAT superfamily N-acetyltransferase